MKKINKNLNKGFTLIELLAVIVILAIILLITVPIVSNVVESAKKRAFIYTANGILRSAEIELADGKVNDDDKSGLYVFDGNNFVNGTYKIEYNGKKPIEGKLYINSSGEIEIALWNEGDCVYKPISNKDVLFDDTLTNLSCMEKVVGIAGYAYFDEIKGLNEPVLKEGMTAIRWNGMTEETDGIDFDKNTDNWYDYNNKEWANAKSADGSYWVWIPRYAYKITSGYNTSSLGTIDIKFLIDTTNTTLDETEISTDGKNGLSVTNYVLHPAFKFGDDDLAGIWVAKFEASIVGGSPEFKPQVISTNSIPIRNAFLLSIDMKNNTTKYGWSSAEVDTHLTKNIEWGAIVYFAQSSYGKESEIYSNNSSLVKTGCGGSAATSPEVPGCQNEYNSDGVVKASTTGNITGIYDISGGRYEYLAAMIDNEQNTYTDDYFLDIASVRTTYTDKYFDIYDGTTVSSGATNYNNNKTQKYGDATYETSSSSEGLFSWTGDYSYFPTASVPWFARGGHFYPSSAGAYNLYRFSGANDGYIGFRAVLITE